MDRSSGRVSLQVRRVTLAASGLALVVLIAAGAYVGARTGSGGCDASLPKPLAGVDRAPFVEPPATGVGPAFADATIVVATFCGPFADHRDPPSMAFAGVTEDAIGGASAVAPDGAVASTYFYPYRGPGEYQFMKGDVTLARVAVGEMKSRPCPGWRSPTDDVRAVRCGALTLVTAAIPVEGAMPDLVDGEFSDTIGNNLGFMLASSRLTGSMLEITAGFVPPADLTTVRLTIRGVWIAGESEQRMLEPPATFDIAF